MKTIRAIFSLFLFKKLENMRFKRYFYLSCPYIIFFMAGVISPLMNAQEVHQRQIVNGVSCIDQGKILITKFKDQKENKDWKIVIGREFEYKAKKKSFGTWSWKIGGQKKWNATFVPKMVSINENDGKGIIPLTDLPLSNSDLGPSRGLVEVSNALNEQGTADTKVFFIKDDINIHDAVPNWFYYWSKSPIIQNLLTIPGIHLYNLNSCTFNSSPTPVTLILKYAGQTYPYAPPPASNTYGECKFGTFNMEKEDLFQIGKPSCRTINDPQELAVVGYRKSNEIFIGQGCGYQKANNTCNINASNITGIHCFYSTLVHEVEHALIECEVWSFTHPSQPDVGPGYLKSYDSDGDGYKDLWESIIGVNFGFKVGTKDNYSGTYQNCYCSNSCTAGTMYEENRCRGKEAQLNVLSIDGDDWSFDPSGIFQGKQWK